MAEFLTQDTFKAGLVSQGTTTVPNAVALTDALNKQTGNGLYATIGHTHPDSRDYQFVYDSVSTMADPGTGDVRTNTNVGTPSTQIAFSKTTNLGIDASDTFKSLAVGDLIYFQQLDNASNWGRFTVSGAPVNNNTWWLVPVTPETQQGTINKSQTVLVRFTFGTGGGGNSGGLDQATADGRYLQLTGGTVTGPVSMAPDYDNRLSIGTGGYIFDAYGSLSIEGNTDKSVQLAAYASQGSTFITMLNGEILLSSDVRVNVQAEMDVAGLLLTNSSGPSFAGLRLPPGVPPTYPVNGDIWTTTAGLFVRINGATIGPLGTPKTTVASTAPSNPAVNDLWIDLSA